MKAVLTADIINSSQHISEEWNIILKKSLKKFGKQGSDWEIYRGDEVQLLLKNPEESFFAALHIKSTLKKEHLDARISIGIGNVDFVAENVKESNGSAFINSGRNLELMKEHKFQTLSIKSDNENFDENFNLIFLLMEQIFEKWTSNSANSVWLSLNNMEMSQTEISEKLGISQGAFSRSLKRAGFEAAMETDRYFRKKIQEL